MADAKRLKELLDLKKTRKLTDEEFAELKKLQGSGKGRGKGKKGSACGSVKVGFPGNDFSWWNKVANLIADSSNIVPDWIPGQQLHPSIAPTRLVGAVRFEMQSVYGAAWDATDPLNMEFRDLYLKMFQKYRGISAYQYPDLCFVTLAGVEVVKMIAKLERVYGILNRYSRTNFNVPTTELRALNIPEAVATYLRNHLSDYRFDLNQLILKAQRLFVPKSMSIVADALSLFSYEYLDHESEKGQRILIDTEKFFVINETRLSTGTCLDQLDTQDYAIISTDDSKNMFPMLNHMLEQLLASDSVNKILGDLFTWFGEEQALTILPLPEDYVINPVYSEEILHKLHNVVLLDYVPITVIDPRLQAEDKAELRGDLADNKQTIYQFNNVIKSVFCTYEDSEDMSFGTVTIAGTSYEAVCSTYLNDFNIRNGAVILDTYRKDMTPETVVEGLMYKVGFIYGQNGDTYAAIAATAGFYVCTGILLYELNPQAVPGVDQVSVSTMSGNNDTAAAYAGRLSVMDWAPLTYFTTAEDDQQRIISKVYGDYDNIKLVELGTLKRVQTAFVISGVKSELVVVNK